MITRTVHNPGIITLKNIRKGTKVTIYKTIDKRFHTGRLFGVKNNDLIMFKGDKSLQFYYIPTITYIRYQLRKRKLQDYLKPDDEYLVCFTDEILETLLIKNKQKSIKQSVKKSRKNSISTKK